MSLELSMHTRPQVPLEAELLGPDKTLGLDSKAVSGLQIQHGNDQVTVGDFFKVKGKGEGEIHLEGDLARVKHLGSGMTTGNLHIHGDVGEHLGVGMSGGEIIVDGNAGDWVGPEMAGGRIVIKGDAKHLAGSAYRGSIAGMLGGEIFIHGHAKNETGHGMRNGLIVIGGNAGDFTGVNMLAGTIVVLGEMGIRSGAGMKRGSVITMNPAEILPTFSYDCIYHPVYLRLLFRTLRSQGFNISDAQLTGKYQRWSGDSVELNRGEILVFTP
jgi:formylmethanofuran dehydrogenase subunit C